MLRIWDCLLSGTEDGDGVLFWVALALIADQRDLLARCRSLTEVVDAFTTITRSPLALDCHRLLQVEHLQPDEHLQTAFQLGDRIQRTTTIAALRHRISDSIEKKSN